MGDYFGFKQSSFLISNERWRCDMVARYSLNLRAERSVAKTKRLLLLFAFFLFGCSSASSSPTPAPTAAATLTPKPSATAAPTSIPDYVTKIRNAQYQLGTSD